MDINLSTGVIILFITLAGFGFYLWLAKKLNIIDKPNERSSHTKPTVRGLGVMFSVFFLIGSLYFDFFNIYLVSGLLLASVIGFVDDRVTLSASFRFLAYLCSVILVSVAAIGFYDIHITLIAIGIVLILGVINMYNFMDGINGITLIYSLVFFATIYYLLKISDISQIDSLFLELTIIILLGALFFNLRKRALAFLGDAGSIFLGLLISFIITSLIVETGSISYLIFLSVYAVDSVGTIVLRLIKKQNIFEAHRLHVYQKLANESNWGHIKVSILYGLIQLSINVLFLTCYIGSTYFLVSIILLLVIIYTLLRVKVFKDFDLVSNKLGSK